MTAEVRPGSETGTLPVIDFVAPMPGFPDDRRFVLVRVEDSTLLYALTSLDSQGLRFLVVPPAPFFPTYEPEIDDDTLEVLDNRDPADLLVLLVISPGEVAREATANLLAPIILDQRSRRAMQLVLAGSGFPVREPLLAAPAAH
jgi:flagellar assembly factor FliW